VVEQPGGKAIETLASSRMKPPGVRFDQSRVGFYGIRYFVIQTGLNSL
jgi:hypothetical protein